MKIAWVSEKGVATMNVVAIIPARCGSKSVLDKNIKRLAGHPLLAYSIATAKLTKGIDRVIVSTDSEKYARIAKQYGAEVPFLRPADISQDSSSDLDVVNHLLKWLKETEGAIPEYLVHLRPTTPLRDAACVNAGVELIKNSPQATALRSVHEMAQSAYKTFEISDLYLRSVDTGSLDVELSNRPRQQFKRTYDANGYVDVIRTAHVLECQKMHGDKVLAYVTPKVEEVDTLDDFDYLEYKAGKCKDLISKIFGQYS